jgi:hypothetical protein
MQHLVNALLLVLLCEVQLIPELVYGSSGRRYCDSSERLIEEKYSDKNHTGDRIF